MIPTPIPFDPVAALATPSGPDEQQHAAQAQQWAGAETARAVARARRASTGYVDRHARRIADLLIAGDQPTAADLEPLRIARQDEIAEIAREQQARKDPRP